jgi:iron complex outermembrane receptor protein
MKTRAVYSSIIAFSCFGVSSAYAQEAPPPPAESDTQSDIIVTGTRQTGITAAESATPIKLVGEEAISHVGQPNLNQVLAQLVPSFRAAAFGSDAANLTLSGSLRGLNPNHTLILVNGKRRHGSANLQVGGGSNQGGAAPDLDFIAPSSIDHIEVLEDGAAAQYGSDAVAGVVNIILKKKAGGSFSATGGQNYSRGGQTYSGSLNYGFQTDRGYLNFNLFYRHNDDTRQGDQDLRAAGFNGSPATNLIGATGTLLSDIEGAIDYPNVTPGYGRAKSRFGVGSFNAGLDLTDTIEFYSFGTIGYRNAESNAYYRTPNAVVGKVGGGFYTGGVNTATYNSVAASNPSLIFARNGFVPLLAFRERDSAITGGLRGKIAGWRWDLATTYGEDDIKAYTLNSVNADLFVESGSRQRDFYDGTFRSAEWTTNLDISRDFGTLATVAFGGEYRENNYAIEAGEPASYYKTGASAFPGFSPVSAGSHGRHNYAVYGDLTLSPAKGLKLDGAVRYENYSDFGDTTNWKINGRYDFSPAFAIRGTASTGFRAPTLPEEYYNQVAVGPTSAVVRLAANSAAAKILGIQDLKPEKSTGYSAGFVFRPVSRLIMSLDAYQIELRDRIVGTANVRPTSAAFDTNDLVWRSIAASGFAVTGFPTVFVASGINGPDTRTRGVDLTASYLVNFQRWGRANVTLSGAYTDTKITRASQTPAVLLAAGKSIADAQSDSFLTTATPKFKVIAGVDWSLGAFSVNARETYYSNSSAYLNNGVLNYTDIGAASITDLEVGYQLTHTIKITAGAQNLFNRRPHTVQLVTGGLSDGGAVLHAPLTYGPYGIDGGYWYGRLDVTF